MNGLQNLPRETCHKLLHKLLKKNCNDCHCRAEHPLYHDGQRANRKLYHIPLRRDGLGGHGEVCWGFTDLNIDGIAVVLSPTQSGERSTMHKAEQQCWSKVTNQKVHMFTSEESVSHSEASIHVMQATSLQR